MYSLVIGTKVGLVRYRSKLRLAMKKSSERSYNSESELRFPNRSPIC
uniref:Uncharacterized protein n=1 Tax=Arundo donax TaxID=35708 RepID=A0A0A9F2Y6_ARUDO